MSYKRLKLRQSNTSYNRHSEQETERKSNRVKHSGNDGERNITYQINYKNTGEKKKKRRPTNKRRHHRGYKTTNRRHNRRESRRRRVESKKDNIRNNNKEK